MRILILVGAALVACDDTAAGPDFSGVVLPDLFEGDATDLAIGNVYCAQTCQAPAACCITEMLGGGFQAMCATTCPDGGVFTQCTGPSDCSTQTPNCCFSLNLTGDMDASIMSTGGGAMCTADCPAGLSSNNSTFHTKLCHGTGDCSGYMGDFGFGNEAFDGCCTSPRAPAVRFCAPSHLAGNDGLSCN